MRKAQVPHLHAAAMAAFKVRLAASRAAAERQKELDAATLAVVEAERAFGAGASWDAVAALRLEREQLVLRRDGARTEFARAHGDFIAAERKIPRELFATAVREGSPETLATATDADART